MPRAKLSNVSLKQLVGELQKRQSKLADMIAQRDSLNEQIAELEGLVAEPAAPAKAHKAVAKAKPTRKRRHYAQTAEQFVLGLLKGKSLTSKQINGAWRKAKRVGRADNTLNKMKKAGQVKATKLPKGTKGSSYSVA